MGRADADHRGSREQSDALARVVAVKRMLGSGFVCARRSPSTPLVEVFMASQTRVAGAVRGLRMQHVRGPVRVQSVYGYGEAQLRLAQEIRRTRRGAYAKAEVNTELFSGKLECPRVHIELGVRGRVPQAVLRWAQDEVVRYGADRVAARYAEKGEAV